MAQACSLEERTGLLCRMNSKGDRNKMFISDYPNRLNTRSARRLILAATAVTSFGVLFGNTELIPTAAAQATVYGAAPTSPERAAPPISAEARSMMLRAKRETVKQAPRLEPRSPEE